MKNLYSKRLAFLLLLPLVLVSITTHAKNYDKPSRGSVGDSVQSYNSPLLIKPGDLMMNGTPVANAGDADSTVTYSWIKISGPAAGTIATANAANTMLNNLAQGVYKFELTVTDNKGSVAKDTVMVVVNGAPAVNAGADQLISLPANTLTLTGSATDTDGTISGYAWTKISGPATGAIASASASATSINNLVQGVYKFELAVTDNNGAVGKDTVLVTVNAAPVANAGADKLINLPTNTVALTGSATDADGIIGSYIWAKISGPASGTITTASASSTSVNDLVQGVYKFELTVKDNNGIAAKDTVTVIVNAAPVANAGADKLISLPTGTLTLAGSATDADGNINSYAWVKIAGPAAGTIVSGTTATATINNLAPGTYTFELTVTDNNGAVSKDTVIVVVNAVPTANAGADKLISLPTSTATLTGSATDTDGTISSYAWVKISGPSAGTIATASASTTAVNNLVQGVYKFELTVTDNNGAVGKDTAQFTVNAVPTVNAGADKLISLPTNTTTLTGSATDADGTITSYAWVKISGPSVGTIATASASTTTVNSLGQGVYKFELTVTDNNGSVGKDTVQVTVNAAPTVYAGEDKLISLPTNTTILTGSATDADGTISSYAWVKISGPSAGTIATASASNTTVNNLVPGVYKFELTATDNNGAVGKATIQVIVNAVPTVNAGADKLISSPTNITTLTGSATDADGTISSYAWVKISGPSVGTIATASASTTAVNSLVQGVYKFELTATDNNGAVGKDTVQVTVNAAPTVNAGEDKLVSLPTNTTILTGSATDTDGTISSYAWVKISGPSAGTIATASASNTTVNNLVQGVYKFELTATDNNGSVGKDTVQVIVNAAPAVNAGTDKLINLPTNTTTLNGSATDADGSITGYAWVKISGPSAGTIATANASNTTVNNLVQGVYKFELTATDNNGAVGKGTVQVTVNAAPTAYAGEDKLINLPTNTTILTGSATDTDGTISSYAWVKISGPSAGTIATASASNTTVNNLVQGVYKFEVTATDNNGSVGKDTVQVIVNAAPAVNAGTDKLINLPTNTTTLNGNATDADGTVTSYVWVKISGPSAGTIATANASNTTVNNLVQGIYKFELTATDNNGAVGKDTVQVTVNAAPTAYAGEDKLINLPTNTTTLNGNATDADGSITGYAWVKISGPAGTIATSSSATTVLNDLVQGIYQFELTVTDNNGTTGKDTVLVTVNAASNLLPVANAGTDKMITVPTNTATLTGTGIDIDGTIVKYNWVKISGPEAGTITTPTSKATTVKNLVMGIYIYELTVTDNAGGDSKDTVQVIVNQPPTANAGMDTELTLPTNAAIIIGAGTDADGIIANYTWTKIAGPTTGKMDITNAANLGISGLVKGVYKYLLTVKDNNGAIAKDTVQVTVNPAANMLPVANAGVDKLITLPTNTTTLVGTGADTDGTISKYNWVKVSGPVTDTIISGTSKTATIKNMTAGAYLYELTVTDNSGGVAKDTMQVIVNQPPTANAGIDTELTLPANAAIITGAGTDADGTIVNYTWTKIAGPAIGKMDITNTTTLGMSELVKGVYKYLLTVKDNSGAIGKDTVQVTVNAAPNLLPVANAGADKLITLPTNTTTLSGTGIDTDGTISKYNWVLVSGPEAGSITTPASKATTVKSLTMGIYLYELTVTDNSGGTAKDTTQVIVNQPPIANAGIDTVLTLPTNATVITGAGTDADGIIVNYTWTKIAGPTSGKMDTTNTATLGISGLVKGVYKYLLTVKDNFGIIAKDTVQVTVNAAPNLLPVANAGADKMITLPANTTTLAGTGIDTDGYISKYNWVKVSGPETGTIAAATSATATIKNLVEGTYLYELTVTDNSGGVAKDTLQVVVNAIANNAPKANAGIDNIIILPASSATLSGTGTDVDGTISNYSWLKISGPAAGTIAADNAATTVLNDLVQGVYQFELAVTDNNGAIGKDTVQVTVNAAPVARVAVTAKVISTPVISVLNELKVYPNPVKDITNLNITTADNTKLSVSVTDMGGRLVKSIELQNADKIKNIKLDMSALGDGYYIITVRFANGQLLNSKVLKYGGR